MKNLYPFLLLMCILVSTKCAAAEPDSRFNAGWSILYPESSDGAAYSVTYYFYPDGLFVQQNSRRREFVTIGRWKLDEQKHLVLYDWQPLHTTITAERLNEIKKQVTRYAVSFNSNTSMRWTPDAKGSSVINLTRRCDLPDRTKNIYWGLDTKPEKSNPTSSSAAP